MTSSEAYYRLPWERTASAVLVIAPIATVCTQSTMVPHFADADGVNTAKKLLYVASSRARKHLHLISETGRSRGRYGQYDPTNVLLAHRFDYDPP